MRHLTTAMPQQDSIPNHEAPSGELVTLYDSYDGNEGHREEYYELLGRLIGARRTGSFWDALLSKRPVLVGALEASYALPKYALVSIVRVLLGRTTAGFLFRPLPATNGSSVKLRTKRFILSILQYTRIANTILLMPLSMRPQFEKIASTWIYDPQLWDLHFPESIIIPERGALRDEIREAAAGRKVCVAIGRQDQHKGFDQFAKLYIARKDIREDWLFAYGGGVDQSLSALSRKFEEVGGFGLSRYITREELLQLYLSADLVWCSYDPDYDQASGIFGRALQFGLPVIVRRGSLIHEFCTKEGFLHLEFDPETQLIDMRQFVSRVDERAASLWSKRAGQESLHRLRGSLGLQNSP